jgi:hypothetical protein
VILRNSIRIGVKRFGQSENPFTKE